MKIHLKKWQEYMVIDLLGQIPIYPKTILEKQVSLITYGDMAIGDGMFRKGRIEISHGIRHPRLFIERMLHECGHGIEEWLSQNGYAIYSHNLEQIADGFGLSLLYPDILMEPGLKKIRKIYGESLFVEGFPSIDTESLIAKYVRPLEERLQKRFLKNGVKVSKVLSDLFESQKDGFLRRYSTPIA